MNAAKAILLPGLREPKPSLLLSFIDRARALQAAGKPVIPLTMGEPFAETPETVIEVAHAAMRSGMTRYTANEGTEALRSAIARKLERHGGHRFDLDEIMASTGGLQVISNAFRATLGPGDEVVAPSPFWGPYRDVAALTGARFVTVPTGRDGGIDEAGLGAAISARTKWLILNSPSNPSGQMLTTADLLAVVSALAPWPQVHVLSDDIYADLTYRPEGFASILTVAPQLRARTLVLGGVSKSYAMTGWRLGYAAGPRALIAAMRTVQASTTYGPSSISQAAAAAALDGEDAFLLWQREAYRERRDRLIERLNRIDGITCAVPEGAFYAYPDVSRLLGRRRSDGRPIRDDIDLADYLLDKALVAVVPGAEFREPGSEAANLRISYGVSLDTIDEASRRIADAVAHLG